MKRSSLIIFLVLVFSGCETYELDPFDPRLPEYSSHGADVAGCIFNGGVWARFCTTSWNDNDCVSLLIRYDSLRNESRLGFDGTIVRDASGDIINERVSISFIVKGRIDSFEDLAQFQDGLPLEGLKAYPVISHGRNGDAICSEGFESFGKFYIHDLWERPEEGRPNPTIVMAGTFGFQLQSECWSYEVTHGRFDFDDIIFLKERW